MKLLKRALPFVKHEPEGYLVYQESLLLTPAAVALEVARELFDRTLAAEPDKRLSIMSVHAVLELSR